MPVRAQDNLAMKQYAYLYRYDGRNRCIEKRLPGTDWIRFVYDKADQLILSQDGEQLFRGEWAFSIPDALGRPVLMGVCKNTIGSTQLETYLKGKVVKAEYDGSATYKGYKLSNISLDNPSIVNVNYYDHYKFLSDTKFTNLGYVENSKYGIRYGDNASSYHHKGLLTGTINIIFGETDKYLYSTLYYNNRKQMIQSRSTNHMDGTEISYTAYNFTGQPTQVLMEHSVKIAGKIELTKELYTYQYDHAKRLIEVKHSLNDKIAVSLAKNEYDELGRLKNNTKGGQVKLKTAYAYNVRSWTESISSESFNQKLYYNTSYGSNIPSFSGNLSAMSWNILGDKTRGYTFAYDNLSRLTAANYLENAAASNNYKTAYSYDKHGNMMTLLRHGKTDAANYGLVDNVTMNYNGNQMISANDAVSTISLAESADFKNYTNQLTEYVYNKNGAMTKDLNKGITDIQYNSLNLPLSMVIDNGHAKGNIKYWYSASGVKLRTVHQTDPVTQSAPMVAAVSYAANASEIRTTDYVGNKVYENESLKRILLYGGYIENNNYFFYLTDHLGNNRVVTNATGTVIQKNHYYPFGTAFAEGSVNEQKVQPYKYNGKELDQTHGVNLYDYSARFMDGMRFTSIDPLAEIEYSISPYVYVLNNPLRNTDPTGMSANDTIKGGELRAVSIVANAPIREPVSGFWGHLEHFLWGSHYDGWSYNSSGTPIYPTPLMGTPPGAGKWKSGGQFTIKSLKSLFSGRNTAKMGKLSSILRNAIKGKGNFSLGKATSSEAMEAGKAWVGSGARVASDGKTLVSADGLRQFRPPSHKPNLNKTQANFEWRNAGQTQWQGNGHLTIID